MNLEFYMSNRDIIKNFSINTGTSAAPVFSPICTTSEIELLTDLEMKDFFVFCDAIKRSVVTGASLGLETTVKLDINNVGIQAILAKIHTLISAGTVAQFNNQLIKFDLLETVENDVLTYETYQVNSTLVFSDLGGAAEDEGEFSLEIHFNGKASVPTNG